MYYFKNVLMYHSIYVLMYYFKNLLKCIRAETERVYKEQNKMKKLFGRSIILYSYRGTIIYACNTTSALKYVLIKHV